MIVWDVRDQKVLYSKNADEVLPLASLTKIVTAMTATDLAPEDTVVTIDQNALSHEGDNGLLLDEKWKLKDLLDFSLVMSSNDGASAIAAAAGNVSLGLSSSLGDYATGENAFIQKMNDKVRSLGLTDMRFINPTGLDEGSDTGGMGSARDVTKLLEYAIAHYSNVFDVTRHAKITLSSLEGISHPAVNTDLVIEQIPGLLASKTGYTDAAGGNLAIAFDVGINHPIVIAVLGSTYDGRFNDVAKLVKATQSFVALEDAAPSLASTNK
jgi:D-alanyl-D-alanine carboxypeptidase